MHSLRWTAYSLYNFFSRSFYCFQTGRIVAIPAWCGWGAKDCYRGGKIPNKWNTGLICFIVPATLYSTPRFGKTSIPVCGRKQQKQCLLIKTTHAVVYMYSLLCVFISQHSNKVDFITTDEAEIRGRGKKGRTVPDWGLRLPCLPLKLPLHYRSFLYGVRSRSEDVKGRSECGAS